MATDKHEEILARDYKYAEDFASKLWKHFEKQNFIKAVVLFGSVAKRIPAEKSDIDIIILVDDASVRWDRQTMAWYQEEVKKLVSGLHYGERLHLTTATLSTFWQNVIIGEPAAINILRFGIPIIDTGFVRPLKYLLAMGKIRPTAEAIYNCANRVPWHIFRGRVRILNSIGDFYWAMVDAAHAVLMQAGHTPPSPEYVGDLLTKAYVKKKKLDPKYVKWYEEMYKLAHKVKNGEITHLSGETFDRWYKRTLEFAKKMSKLLETEKIEKRKPKASVP